MNKLVKMFSNILRVELDHHDLDYQEAIIALAVVAAWLTQRAPKNPQIDWPEEFVEAFERCSRPGRVA